MTGWCFPYFTPLFQSLSLWGQHASPPSQYGIFSSYFNRSVCIPIQLCQSTPALQCYNTHLHQCWFVRFPNTSHTSEQSLAFIHSAQQIGNRLLGCEWNCQWQFERNLHKSTWAFASWLILAFVLHDVRKHCHVAQHCRDNQECEKILILQHITICHFSIL